MTKIFNIITIRDLIFNFLIQIKFAFCRSFINNSISFLVCI